MEYNLDQITGIHINHPQVASRSGFLFWITVLKICLRTYSYFKLYLEAQLCLHQMVETPMEPSMIHQSPPKSHLPLQLIVELVSSKM